MMNFLSIFRLQVPDILKRLNDVRMELNITQNNIKHLMNIEKELSERATSNETTQNKLAEMAINHFEVAMWMKDLDGRFLFANKACCDKILKCTLKEALNMKNGDFKKDVLAQVCKRTDLEIMKRKVTKRYIEFAQYEDGKQIFIDTIKSPVFDDDRKVIGIVGNAVDITNSIPEIIKCQDRMSNSIEIPLDTTLNFGDFARLLERRIVSVGEQSEQKRRFADEVVEASGGLTLD